jgi:hypothetical protein
MNHLTLASELTKAEKCVSQGKDRIDHQSTVVLQHQDGELVGAIARAILEQLETSQRTYIANRDRLREQIADSGRSRPLFRNDVAHRFEMISASVLG